MMPHLLNTLPHSFTPNFHSHGERHLEYLMWYDVTLIQ